MLTSNKKLIKKEPNLIDSFIYKIVIIFVEGYKKVSNDVHDFLTPLIIKIKF